MTILLDDDDRQAFGRAVRSLCAGADVVCDDLIANRGVPRLNSMTGRYTFDDHYVWDSWANFQWAGFLAGRLWLLFLMTRHQRYADAAMLICERIGPVLARHPTVFSSTGIDMYYALTLGYQISKRDALKHWALAGGDNFANIFDRKAQAFLQIANANRIVIDTGLNLPSMLWASQWEPERAVLAYRHLDTVLDVGLIRRDGSSCHAASLDPETRAVTGLFSLQGFSNDSVWARGQAWAMLGYAHAYEASGEPRYLGAARSAADWYVDHAPEGWIPRYDYDDPDREKLPYDLVRGMHRHRGADATGALASRAGRDLSEGCQGNPQSHRLGFSDDRRRRAARNVGKDAAHRGRQAAPRPVSAGRHHAVRQLLDRRVSLPRDVG